MSDAQVERLASLAANDHLLRLFLRSVRDSSWLIPLHAAGVVQVPRTDSAWPGTALTSGLGQTAPVRVAELLDLILVDIATIAPEKRASARFDVLRVAVQLGAAGFGIVTKVVRLDREMRNSRSPAAHAMRNAEPHDPVVADVADAVLSYVNDSRATRHDAIQLLDLLVGGATEGNIIDRTRMLAGKTRRLARTSQTGYVWLGVEALDVDLSDNPHPLLLLAHYLSRLISIAQQWNVPFDEQWSWVREMRGEVGDRLRSRVLAAADDRPVADAIDHIASRIKHALTTAEDLDLVESIMARNPSSEDLRPWVEACGSPSPQPADEHQIPDDWLRIWRWSALLPETVLTAAARPGHRSRWLRHTLVFGLGRGRTAVVVARYRRGRPQSRRVAAPATARSHHPHPHGLIPGLRAAPLHRRIALGHPIIERQGSRSGPATVSSGECRNAAAVAPHRREWTIPKRAIRQAP